MAGAMRILAMYRDPGIRVAGFFRSVFNLSAA
jgi:hypothetical protein